MTTSSEIDARIEGQTICTRFLANLAKNASVDVLRWKTGDDQWETMTLSDLAEQVQRLVTSLRELGVSKGDRVVLMMSNRPEFHVIDLAVLFCGATPVSIYNSSAADQIQYMANDCGASMAILENTTFLDRLAKVRDQLPALKTVVVVDDDPSIPSEVHRYDDLLAAEPTDLAAAAADVDPATLATVIYTSGTTGPPKGVMLSHKSVCWTLESVGESMATQADLGDFAGMRHVSYLPMAHIMERLLGHYYLIELATEVTCCPDTRQIGAFCAATKPNFLIGVPRVWEKFHAGVMAALAADPAKAEGFNQAVALAEPIAEKMTRGTATEEEIATWNSLDEVAFSGVRALLGLDETKICISGAAPLAADILSWFRTIGVPLSEGYGMSETTAVLSWSYAAKPGYVGQASAGVEIKIAEDGEVLARGGNMFDGYLGAPEKTAETLDDEGWVHTGDIGELDDEGFLKIVDRKKELIITAGGKNISPANLEAALKSIPLVGQACALGEQRPFVAALVVIDPDAGAAWAQAHGLSSEDATLSALAKNPDVIAEINAGLLDVMSEFNNAESVKKVKILGEEWLPDTELLTPTSKLKRRGILSTFTAEIEELYAR